MKKVVSLLLVLAMVLSFGATAFAAEATDPNDKLVPTTEVPALKDGSYTVPFQLFNTITMKGETEPYGNPEYGQLSMGDSTFAGYVALKPNTAEVTVKDGKTYVTLRWNAGIGCMRFNWYLDKAGYLADEPKGGWPADGKVIADDKDGVHTAPNADGASYTYVPDMGTNYGTVDSITAMTFPLPSKNPVVWVELEAAGMPGAEQQAYLVFYWDDVKEDTTSPENPDLPDTPDVPDKPASPEIPADVADEVLQQFLTFKNYVMDLNPDQKFLRNNLWSDTAGSFTMDDVNDNYMEIRRWLFEKECEAVMTDFKDAEGYKFNILPQLKVYDKMVADPSIFADIYNMDSAESKIYRGGTFEVPVKMYVVEKGAQEIVTPLGQTIKAPLMTNEEYSFLKDNNIETATVTVNYDADPGKDIVVIKLNYNNQYNTEDGNRHSKSLMKLVMKDYNFISARGSTSGCTIKSFAPYSVYFMKYKYEVMTPDYKYTTLAESPVALVFDWANAKDMTAPETAVDKSILKGYVGSIDNLLTRDIRGNDMVAAYATAVSQSIKDSGLLEQARAVLNDANATQAQVSEMEGAIDRVYNLENTLDQEQRLFQARTHIKNADDYTKDSFALLKRYVDLMERWRNVGTPAIFCTPGSQDAVDPYGDPITVFTEEERKVIALKNADGTPFSTDPADGDTVYATYLMGTFSGSTPSFIRYKIDRYNELEAALVNIAGLKTMIDQAEKINGAAYTAESYKGLEMAVKLAKMTVANDAATKEEVADAENELKLAMESLKPLSDKTALKAAIDAANKLVAEQSENYTAASINLYKEAIAAAQTAYERVSISQVQVDEATAKLEQAKELLVLKADAPLDPAKLEDGVYTVAVNLWHADQDKPSMGNGALYHTAKLTVKDGKYTLSVSGHTMVVSGLTGKLQAMRIVTDGAKPLGDGSNYTEMTIREEDQDIFIDVPLNTENGVHEYYYGGIKVCAVAADGTVSYPMGKNWVPNRLRISWDSLTRDGFSAADENTGVKVTAPEGALPKDTKLEVVKVADMTAINETLKNLASKNTAYTVRLYVEENGVKKTVEPAEGMKFTLSMPIPGDYDSAKLLSFYMDANGYGSAVAFTVEGGMLVIETDKVGTYTVSQKISRDPIIVDPTDPSEPETEPTVPETQPQKPENPQTGDSFGMAAVVTVMTLAAAGAAALVVLRRKNTAR